uniref:subunit Y of preprotein-translocase n=1 Tax=Haslea karadagensis TaxID=1146996 RepID=UPI002202F896|nr:subunit Y of preprotein-translocase [Haslea karadagensis]UXN44915.1 subunit Y of preprotein-translocase [Haslea karadagensis]UXN45176.1 subunit Y of preprotein-translocase [Haslea karadagensis]
MVKINKEIRDIILKRLFVSLGILLLIRIGTFLPVPGINHIDLAFYLQRHSVTKSLISTFSGDDTFVIGLFTLNIFPYINASILVQLILGLSPKLAKLQKEGDLEGRRSINRLTRFITLIWAVIQSVSLAIYLKQVLFDWNYLLAGEIVIWLTTGAMIVLWLSELITDYGLGNGASLLIYTNIISSLPNLCKKVIIENNQNFSLSAGIGITLLVFITLYGIVFLQEGVRIIPLISSKQLNQSSLQDSTISNNYIPLRFNQAGVMPIILTTAILVVPNYINNLGLLPKIDLPINFGSLKFVYWIGYFVLILIFSSFYSTIVLNPKDISDQLQKMAVTIPGIRPGVQTTFYLKQLMKRITLVGATILATLATVPNFIESTLNITSLNGLSTTSLLILAGVVLDLVREVKNIYYSNIYNNMYQ